MSGPGLIVRENGSDHRFRPYPEYKESGVEWLREIPMHWRVRRLRFVARINPRFVAEGIPKDYEASFIPMEAVGEYGGLDLSSVKSVADVANGHTYFCDGDVLVAKITPCFENGKGAMAQGLINGIGFGTTELHVLRPAPDLDARFLSYITYSRPFRELGKREMKGTAGQQRVSDDFVRNFRVPMPSLHEQVAIAEFLDRETAKIDSLVAKKERLIELLLEKRTAVITRAVTKGLDPDAPMKDSGVEWLGEIPANWEVRRLAMAVQKITNGYVGPTRDILVDEGVFYLQSLHIKEGAIGFYRRPYYVTTRWSGEHHKSVLRSGDVLIVQTGDIGQTCTVPPEFDGANCHALIILRLREDLGSGSYLSLLLQSDYGRNALRRAQTGALHPHLECGHVREIKIPLPPPPEQDRIVKRIKDWNRELDFHAQNVREGIEHLKEYRTALISAAVTGQIDVCEAS